MRIDWVLLVEDLTEQEREEFMILRQAINSVIDSVEFAAGQSELDFSFPNSYISAKVLIFLREHHVSLDGSGYDGDVWIWLQENDGSWNDSHSDWAYDYWKYSLRDDNCDYCDDDDDDDEEDFYSDMEVDDEEDCFFACTNE